MSLLLAAAVLAGGGEFAVVGYLPEYRLDVVRGADLRPCTDLVYFSLLPNADGSLPEIGEVTRDRLRKLKTAADARLLVCVGGWGKSDRFAAVCGDDERRSRLVGEFASLCEGDLFDGVDLDWEHPRDDVEQRLYATLLVETAAALHRQGDLCTAAIAPWKPLTADAVSAIDRVHLMSYDHAFPHATLAKSEADLKAVADVPAEKLCLGVPFYGRNADRDASMYRDLAGRPLKSSDITAEGYAFNGPETIAAKVRLAKTRGLAGVMIWEVGQDAVGELSLLRVIGREAGRTVDFGRRENRGTPARVD